MSRRVGTLQGPSHARPSGRRFVAGLAAVFLVSLGSTARPSAAPPPSQPARRIARSPTCPTNPPSGPQDLEALAARILAGAQQCVQAYKRALQALRIRGTVYDQARKVMERARVPLPTYSGWFTVPKLKMGELPPHRRTDVLQALVGTHVPRDLDPLLGRLVAATAWIRALGESRSPDVAAFLVRFTFRPSGYLFRAEVGRALESLGPAAIPGLLELASQKAVPPDRDRFRYLTRKYARYMLAVLEEGDPTVCLARADKPLKLRIIESYGTYHVADAIRALILATADPDRAVRLAAARALKAYFQGPAPKVRRRRLKLPGGRETEERRILFMSYRQRAYYELRKELDRLIPGRYERNAHGVRLVEALLRARSEVRRERLESRWRALIARLRRHGDVSRDVLSALDDLLSQDLPERGLETEVATALWVASLAALVRGDSRTAKDLRLASGLLGGPGGTTAALQDWHYVAAIEAAAGNDTGTALSHCRAALGLGPHEGCRRLVADLQGQRPHGLQILAGLILLAGLGLALWIALGLVAWDRRWKRAMGREP